MWTLDEALNLIHILQPSAKKYGYHICLGGGVLNKGYSNKDLDLFFQPMLGKGWTPNPTGLMDWLNDLWGNAIPIKRSGSDGTAIFSLDVETPGSTGIREILASGDEINDTTYKYKVKFNRGTDRIDVFVL